MSYLSRIIHNRTWLRRNFPFQHIVAHDVFQEEFYHALSEEMRNLLTKGLSEVPTDARLSRNISGYDAYGIGFSLQEQGPFATFLSLEWRDAISNLFNITPTPYLFAGAHHHSIGSMSGFVHNDFNPVWFPRADGDSLQVPRNGYCSYKTGEGPLAARDKVQVVRGAAVIYFLLNDDWRKGDGGGTGLYETPPTQGNAPAVIVEPLNNSLLAFECSPYSFHSYITNLRRPRTSIIMWVHRPLEEAVEKYGEGYLEKWKS